MDVCDAQRKRWNIGTVQYIDKDPNIELYFHTKYRFFIHYDGHHSQYDETIIIEYKRDNLNMGHERIKPLHSCQMC